MTQGDALARNLAATLLGGAWTEQDLGRRMAEVFGDADPRMQHRLVQQIMAEAPTAYPPSPAWLRGYFRSSGRFRRLSGALRKSAHTPPIALEAAAFAPVPALAGLAVPQLGTPGDLADWLDLPLAQLDWLADTKRQHARTSIPVLQHYRYSFVAKRRGPPRLIEAPKPRLRAVQRRILHGILGHLPAHERAHGFVRGRSCLSGAQAHASEAVVLTLDLRNFFASVPVPRVHAIFRSLGYPWAVARLLTGLCTSSTPASVFELRPEGRGFDRAARQSYGVPHLPQGAPTSPALANLAAWHLDQRLAGLARRFGAAYTRYADDLAFSGGEDFSTRIEPFRRYVATIAQGEGFVLHEGKTRIMRRGGRQRVTGVVVNDHLNVARRSYEALKAILHNCAKFGPQVQNRLGVHDFRAHLDGRVGWVEAVNPGRGVRLRRMFEAIRW